MFEVPRQSQSTVIANTETPAASPAQIDFRRLATALWRGRMTIVATTVAALLLAMAFALFAPHRYTATTEILIDPMDLHAMANDPTPSTQASDTALLAVDSQVRVLTSDAVLHRVVASQGLAHDPEFAGKPSLLQAPANLILAALGRQPAAGDPSLAALNALRQDVHVTRAERTFVVNVAVSSKEATKAARLANAVAQAYLTQQTEVRADAARQVSQSLSARLNDLKESVHQADEQVAAFKASHNIVDANGQLVNEQQLSDLNAQLAAARARTAAAKARLDQIEAVQKSKADFGAFPAAVQSPTITALRSQYAEIMRLEAQQTTSLGDRHPAVIEIRAQAERLKRMIDDEVNRIALAAGAEYESAKASENLLQRNVDTLKKGAMTTDADMVTLRELQRNVQASRAVYEAFLVRARETGEQEQVDTKNIQILSRADLPLTRTWPPSNKLLALGAILLGVAAGSGLVMLREAVPGAMPSLPRPRFSLPRFGATPRLPRVSFSFPKLRLPRGSFSFPRFGARSNSDAIPVLATLPALDAQTDAAAAEEPDARFAAGIRQIYEAVQAQHRKRGNPSVLVAAADAGDDVAGVALMLAALPAASQQVLLIDTDLERRTLSAIEAGDSEGGLVDVALGRRELSDIIVHDRTTNINLLPFVAPNSRRDRAIEDDDIRLAFAQTKYFDMVIVAALDLARDPSARFFAGLVDHIVLVTRPNRGARGVDRIVADLGINARKVRGTVLAG